MVRSLYTSILIACLLVTKLAVAADFDKGVEALEQGDYETAFQEFSALAEQGYAEAQYNLGWMYTSGYMVTQDYKEAVKWYNLIELIYSGGYSAPQDHKEAVKWYTRAAEQGHARAQNNLGVMYEYGFGVPQDYKAAVKWYTLAAEQGIARAQHNLALKYENGFGVLQDYVKAYMWYNIAASLGNETAKTNWDLVAKLDLVTKLLTSAQVEEAQALARECVAKELKGC